MQMLNVLTGAEIIALCITGAMFIAVCYSIWRG
jgi:hypothetical protein